MNQRLTAQKGLFLAPLSLNHTFEAQLIAGLSHYPHDKALFCAALEEDFDRKRALEKLDSMNIHHASLFPGLDGYAPALMTRYEIRGLRDLI
jgi:hypothetical protein